MAVFIFTAYPIEHIFCHHKNVGSKDDFITAQKNDNIYAYTLRVFYVGYKFNYDYSKKIFWTCILTNLLYLGGLFFIAFRDLGDEELALRKVGYFVLIGLGGFAFLELVEYI